jgi:hypothetical protein
MSPTWKAIPGFSSYEASTDGNIRSVERTITQRNGSVRKFKARVLKPGRDRKGYLHVTLCDEHRRHHTKKVHALVLETFCRPRLEGEECRHLDGKKLNNCIENLYWGTSAENMADKIEHGTYVRGERVGNSVLKEDQVVLIYTRAHNGEPMDDLATEYGVSRQTIEAIKYRRIWKWLTHKL